MRSDSSQARQVRWGSEEADRLLALLAHATGERDLLEQHVGELRHADRGTERLEQQLAESL